MPHANPGFTTPVGDAVVTALNDGQFDADIGYITGVPAAEADALFRDVFRVTPPRISVSCFLLRVRRPHGADRQRHRRRDGARARRRQKPARRARTSRPQLSTPS